MSAEIDQIIKTFKTFVEAGLIEHDPEKALSLLSDDIIGMGMGSQGVVTCKEEAASIIRDSKTTSDPNSTSVDYEHIQVRCYEEKFATICGVLNVSSLIDGRIIKSSLGQIMSLRKEHGNWLIYALQATPIFNEIEEMEAYPIKFAETILEQYRQQEQIAKNAQSDSIAIYLVNLTENCFEDAILKNNFLVFTEKGQPYEKTIFESARTHLAEEERYKFITTFSLGNVTRSYNSGQTELSMEYEMFLFDKESTWLKTTLKLYTDKVDKNLKGYLYVIDINKEKLRELELQKRVELDSLTELYNKNYSEQKISEKLKTITPANQGAFFMMDLDYFKNINDTYGHQEGDRIIKETARCLKSLIREKDIAGRLGGDEFCAYFQGKQSVETLKEKAETLCQGIHSILPIQPGGTSCSIGIVLCTNPEQTFDEIYHQADLALYEQKRNGRDGYTFYSDALDK